jgi:hypothetical protein
VASKKNHLRSPWSPHLTSPFRVPHYLTPPTTQPLTPPFTMNPMPLPVLLLLAWLTVGTAQITSCGAGDFLSLTLPKTCKSCLTGYYQNQNSHSFTNCKDCTAGQYQNQNSQSSCKSCPPGSYQNAVRSTQSCPQCTPGQYQDLNGQVSCKSCTQGTYQNTYQATSCKPCSVGRYSAATTFPGPCSGYCSAGYTAPVASTTSAACSICPGGRYNDRNTGGQCTLCSAGRYNAGNGLTHNCAHKCTTGRTSPTGSTLATDCHHCLPGQYNNQVSRQYSQEASDASGLPCKLCPLGKYYITNFVPNTTDVAASMFVCTGSCPTGKYNDELGIYTTVVTPAHLVAVTGSGDAVIDVPCKVCGPGLYNSNNHLTQQTSELAACKMCGLGKYNDINAQATESVGCKLCGQGKYSDQIQQTAATVCKSCPLAKYTDEEGSINSAGTILYTQNGNTITPTGTNYLYEIHVGKGCVNPDRDELGVRTGRSLNQCQLDCTADSSCISFEWMSLNSGTCRLSQTCTIELTTIQGTFLYLYIKGSGSHCKVCERGQYNDEHGLSLVECKKCAVGQYQHEPGHTNCTVCPPGVYMDEEGAGYSWKCKACPRGYYHQTNRTACTHCPFGFVQQEEKQGHCTACVRHSYQDEMGHFECKTCQNGQYQPDTGGTTCNVWDSGNGCRYNPLVAHMEDEKTDCEQSNNGSACTVVCQSGYKSSGPSTCSVSGESSSSLTIQTSSDVDIAIPAGATSVLIQLDCSATPSPAGKRLNGFFHFKNSNGVKIYTAPNSPSQAPWIGNEHCDSASEAPTTK